MIFCAELFKAGGGGAQGGIVGHDIIRFNIVWLVRMLYLEISEFRDAEVLPYAAHRSHGAVDFAHYGITCDVRGSDVGGSQQCRIDVWLALPNVHDQPIKFWAHRQQGIFIYYAATRGVDEYGARLHLFKESGAGEIAVLGP